VTKVSKEESLEQSKRAYAMWGDLWRRNSQINGTLPKIMMDELRYKGIGKVALCIATGPSLDKHIDTIIKYRNKIDIICVDKSFGILMDRGIIPDFVFVADAKISYENYCEKWISYTKDICLISNVCTNPNWGINWLGPKTYYVNKDNIESEKEFGSISGINDCIPAGSNVSNSLIVYASSVLKYDKYILCGYDFSFDIGGNFYSDDNHHVKNFYLNQIRMMDIHGRLASTSHNLSFSCRWLFEWVTKAIGANKVINASEKGILNLPLLGRLKDQLQAIPCYKRELTQKELALVMNKKMVVQDEHSFNKAKELMSNENALINECVIHYQMKEDGNYAKLQFSRDLQEDKKLREKNLISTGALN
jgi:hypothetical protein|tara:strand:+ start:1829 stop:2917 length:1089 start_codon:yes stop_codon:yes gene_type:complete